MSRANFQSPVGTRTETVVRDAQGNPIESFVVTEELSLGPNDQPQLLRHHEMVINENGRGVYPALATANPPIYLGQCGLCPNPPWTFPFRRRPTTGLVTMDMDSTAHCTSCGLLLCPSHQREIDGSVLCIVCARRSKFWRFVNRIFFERTDEE